MRVQCDLLALLLSLSPAICQELVNRRVLSGNGSDQPTVIATDNNGFTYVAGSTTSGNFPVTNALEPLPPQGALEVSTDGTAFVNAGLTATAVSAVAASSDGTLVIASTGSGIFRSTNQGATWTATANPLPPAAALAVDPVNLSNAYSLLENGAFYKSTDGGVTWQATGASFPALGSSQPSQIAINPQAPTTMYLWDSNVIYRSTNAGQSWQPLAIPSASNSLPVGSFALAPSEPDVLYSDAYSPASPGSNLLTGTVYKSTDGGATWTAAAQNTIGFGATGMAVDPTNASTIWLVSGTSVEKSTDGGSSFQTIVTFPDNNAIGYLGGLISIAIDPANVSHLYASSESAILGTIDGGKTWSQLFSGYTTSLYAAPSRVYAAGGSTFSTVFLVKFDAALSQVIYSTYLWTGTVSAIAIDSAGDVYLAGGPSGWPPVSAVAGIVMKVRADDGASVYSTVLNGIQPNAIAVDAQGNAVIAGTASSIPASTGAYQSTIPGPCTVTGNPTYGFPMLEYTHAFVAKLNSSGAVVDATYVTGSCGDTAYAVALDSAGDAYMAGETYSNDFPVTADAMIGAFPSTYSAGFIAKLGPNEDQLLYSSFLGGGYFSAAHALLLDGAGNVYLAGSTQANSTIGALPTAGCGSPGVGIGGPTLTPPPNGGDNPFVIKMTLSSGPPAFLTKVGGSCHGEADSLAFDSAGNIWLAGWNVSWDFPTLAPISGLGQIPSQDLDYYGSQMGFLAELDPSASKLLSSTVTDSLGSVAADATAVYYAGGLSELNTSGGATGNYAALVAQINPAAVAPISIDNITLFSPLASPSGLLSSAVAPGEIIRIVGRGIGPPNQAGAKLTAGGTMATSIGGVIVTFNGVPAPLVTAQAELLVAIAPFELTGQATAAVQVQFNGLTSNMYSVPVVAQNPDALAVVNSNWSANSPTNPATPGSVVTIFLTGLGQTNPPGIDGAINQPPLAQPVIVPNVSFNSSPASIAFLGAAASEVAGVSQLNLVVPAGALPGPAVVDIGLTSALVYVAQ